MWTLVVCLLALTQISAEVTVKVGDFTFPLEVVKKLKDVVDSTRDTDNRAQSDDVASYKGICSSRALSELQDLCDTNQPDLIAETLHELELVADNFDECEVCAFAACSGC
ncbi:hypothetical protein GDO81_014480 [Engystomops pustulosus]|uniref:Guanylate cyclase activator 2B n=1 Tax=Engystomops pustulosus TaxID=76066 RepID=A0AAV7BAN8_ENGPU|nr:hypothetical protein GDO81_014480 [Engystomops pustulosus]